MASPERGDAPLAGGAPNSSEEIRRTTEAARANHSTEKTLLERYAPRLLDLGYDPVPILDGTKRPGIAGWQTRHGERRATPGEVPSWIEKGHTGVGILGRRTPAIDIDFDDEAVAEQVLRLVMTRLGAKLWRVGRPPRSLIPCKAPAPISKMQATWFHPEGRPQKLEILGDGQQWVVSARHPDTGKPYEWYGGSDPLCIDESWSSLPLITPETALELIREVGELVELLGWVRASDAPRGKLTSASAPDPLDDMAREQVHAAVNAETIADLRSALDALDPDPREPWIAFAHALHALDDARPDLAGIGRELWDEFSQRSLKYDADDQDRVWDSAKGDRTSYKAILAAAQRAGWQNPRTGVAQMDRDDAFLKVVPAHERLKSHTPPNWFVKGVLPCADLGVLYGEPGSGKSFLALDITMSIALGRSWRGHRTTPGSVVYVAAEGQRGVLNRVRAYELHHQIDLAECRLGIVADAPNLLSNDDQVLAKRIAEAGDADLIVIDTLAQSMVGDENSSKDMGTVVAHCRRLRQATGAMVLLVHHSGKNAARGARGWSGLRAAADFEMEVLRENHDREARITKLKDAEDGTRFRFELSVVQIGEDDDGDPITSCVVRDPGGGLLNLEAKPRRHGGAVQRVVLKVAADLADPAGRVDFHELVEAVVREMRAGNAPEHKRRANAARTLQRLADDGALTIRGDVVQLPDDGDSLV